MSLRRAFFASVIAAAALTCTESALANGRYPAAGQIAINPNDKSNILVRATYGILTTHDRGKSWFWTCELAVGYGGSEDPMFAISSTSSILAGTFEGLAISHDGCDYSFYPAPLKDRYAIDLALEKDAKRGVLLVSNSVSATMYSTQVFETTDSGDNWTQAGVDLPSDFLGLTLDAAPSNTQRLYVSGRYGKPTYQGSVQRSDDRGATWQPMNIPGSNDQNLPFIAAIDPTNPDVIYVRTDGDPNDQLYVTKDGGMTWTMVFEIKGSLLGFALSPDGSKILLGGDSAGLWTADAATLTFTKVSDLGVKCLTWASDGVYACADEFKDHFEVGFSMDDGKTFSPLMHLQSPCGPASCGANTKAGMLCPDLWGAVEVTIMANGCGQTSGSSSSATGSTGSGSTSGNVTPKADGCSCSAGGEAGGLLGGGIACAGIALALARRRSRTARPARSK